MEISAVIDIAALLVHNRIVIDPIDLVLKHLPCRFDFFSHRSEYLRNASERIIWLDFLLENLFLALMEEFRLTVSQKAAAGSETPHHRGNPDLARMMFHPVQHPGHEIVVRGDRLIEHNRLQHRPFQHSGSLDPVHCADSGHHGRAIGYGKAFPDMHPQRLKTILRQNFRGRTDFPLVRNLALPYQCQCEMCKLHQVTAGSYTSVSRNNRAYVPVDEFHEQVHKADVNSRMSLQEGHEPGNHGRLHADVRKPLSRTGGMAPYYIVLQFVQMSVINPPLCHRAESGIDPVNDLVSGEFLQELIAFNDPGAHSGCNLYLLPSVKHSLDAFQCQSSVYCNHCQ